MITPDPSLEATTRKYAANHGCKSVAFLGGGNDGDVWKSDRHTAIKTFHRQESFNSELSSYKRLRDRGIKKILDLTVPRLVDWDERLLVVEMDLVSPPCLIDFGKAYLDGAAPEHSKETWDDYYEQQQEMWGDRFGDVQAILWKLQSIGINYRDPNPGNLKFDPQVEY